MTLIHIQDSVTAAAASPRSSISPVAGEGCRSRRSLPAGHHWRVITGGQRHKAVFFEPLIDLVRAMQPSGQPRTRPDAVAGDKAYDARRIRQWCLQHNIESVIPTRTSTHSRAGRPPTCDEETDKDRNGVERCVERLTVCWAIERMQADCDPIREEGPLLQGHASVGLRRGISRGLMVRQSLLDRV